MITAYFTNINTLPDDPAFNKMLAKMDIHTKRKILGYNSRQEQLLRLCGRFLLDKLLTTSKLKDHLSLDDLKYTPSGKPFFNNDFDFSIAHSGNMVICAGGPGMKIGLDTEKESGLETNDMEEHFTAKEWAVISGVDTNTVFYKMWVRKEACIKAIGEGIFVSLNEIDVCEDTVAIDDSKWYLHDLHVQSGYATCIVTDKQNARISIQEIDFDTLINQY